MTRPPRRRSRRLRPLLVLLAVSLVLTVLAAWVVPRLLDWGKYRAAVEGVASAGLGRTVRIAGPIRLSLLPQATLVAGDVTVAEDADGASATAVQLRLRVGLGALLAGRIEPQDLVLRAPQMRLPWPLTTVKAGGLELPAGLHARVEDGTLSLGSLRVSGINGELRVDPTTGTLSAAGVAAVMGRPWQVTGRLGRAAADGSATVELSLDGQGTAVGTGGTLSGQIATDGELTGRVAGRGPDLSLLLPAPPQPWQASGDVTVGSGLAVAEELELAIGGLPARGAVAMRLVPHLRLDAALETSRLDLDAWLAALLHGGTPALPTGIELSADAAQLAGGMLRHLRAGLAVDADGVTLREVEAELPGHAPLHASGRLVGSRFAGEARVSAPELAQTLAWLRPAAPATTDLLASGAWQSAHLAATVSADPGGLALTSLSGDLGGAGLAGELSVRTGARPSLAATLRLDHPALDDWTPDVPHGLADAGARLAALPARCATLDADVTLGAAAPTWRGVALDRLALHAVCNGGALELRQGALAWPEGSFGLSFTVYPGGRMADGRLDLTLRHAETFADGLPRRWASIRPLFQGGATLGMAASGPPGALSVTAAAEMSDARLQLSGVVDPKRPRWTGTISLHHPGAPRLLNALGMGGAVDWLGDGSLSFQAAVDAAPDQVTVSGAELSAGTLRASADLTATALAAGHPSVAGKVELETLPLPVIDPHSGDPWRLDLLARADAKLAVRAAHLLWGQVPVASDAAAILVVSDAALRLEGFGARVAGGALTGQMALEDASPPRFSLGARVTGAVPTDVVAGRLDGSLDVSGAGYSPAGVLASLAGTAQATIHDGVIEGFDAGRALAALRSAATPTGHADPGEVAATVAAALGSGATRFGTATAVGSVAHGTLTLDRCEVTLPGGAIAASGAVDLPGDALDLALSLQPALANAPPIGLRLIGPAGDPSRTPELAAMTRWLAQR